MKLLKAYTGNFAVLTASSNASKSPCGGFMASPTVNSAKSYPTSDKTQGLPTASAVVRALASPATWGTNDPRLMQQPNLNGPASLKV